MSTLQEIEAAIEKLPLRDLETLKHWMDRHLVGRSAYDAMKDACGVVKEAPRDLGTNKKHFTNLEQ